MRSFAVCCSKTLGRRLAACLVKTVRVAKTVCVANIACLLVAALTCSSGLAAVVQVTEQSLDVPAQEEPSQQPQVIVEDVGQAPQRALRLRPTVGSKQRHQLSMSMAQGSGADGEAPQRVKIPTVQYTLDSTITEVNADGEIAFTVAYTDAAVLEEDGVNPDMIASMEGVTTSMIGLQFKSTVDQRGFAKGVELELPPGIDPVVAAQVEQMSKSVEQLTSPFPEEAVGVGAKWKLVTPMNSGGMKFTQTVRYTVVEMTEDIVTVTVEISQDAKEQELDLADIGDLTVRLVSLDCRGQGRMKLNLKSIFSDEAVVKADLTVEMIVNAGRDMEMTQEVTTEVKLQALPIAESK